MHILSGLCMRCRKWIASNLVRFNDSYNHGRLPTIWNGHPDTCCMNMLAHMNCGNDFFRIYHFGCFFAACGIVNLWYSLYCTLALLLPFLFVERVCLLVGWIFTRINRSHMHTIIIVDGWNGSSLDDFEWAWWAWLSRIWDLIVDSRN